MSRSVRWVRSLDALLLRIRRALLPPEMVVFEDSTAPWLASALGTACYLGLPDQVSDSGSSLPELSRQTGVEVERLARLLRVLISHGYFRFGTDSRVCHNRLSRGLSEGKAGAFCRLQAESWYRDCFAADRVSEALRDQQIPFEHSFGRGFFDKPPEPHRQLFSQAMAEISRFCAPHIAAAMAFGPGDRVLDVGGGNGQLCRALARRFPGVEFAVLDLEEHPDQEGVTHLQGSFFEELPGRFDHLILKNVLHDWDDSQALRILENCAAASCRLSVVELLLPEQLEAAGAGPDFAVDWNVYCTLGGRERTLPEYTDLLEKAGWRLLRATPTATPLQVLSCQR
ncbi:MAG: methyltransferase [Vulcanimicrobiota bacterium]